MGTVHLILVCGFLVGIVQAVAVDDEDSLLERVIEKVYEKKSALNFIALVTCHNGLKGLKFNGYGCYCGLGGKGTPVDDLDQCCYVHDKCYNKVKKKCKWFNHPYVVSYKHTCSKCKDKKSSCKYKACECDLAAAKCFANNKYNNKYKDYNRKKC